MIKIGEEFRVILYKKDSKDKIRSLDIATNNGELIQISGLLEGKKVTHSSIAKPKNIGKSNETTSQEQAISQAESIMVKKLKEGYFKTIEEAQNETVILPMLAKDFNSEKHKIDWSNCYVQPKLDGMRCIVIRDKKISRKNTPIENMDHIKVFNYSTDVNTDKIEKYIVDGELYVHGESFQTNMKFIKKYRKGKTERIKYWIYDIISDKPFSERIGMANLIALHSENTESVPTFKISSENELKVHHRKFISEGFEGSIIRWGTEGYKVNGRSSNLLKYKDFIDETYRVINIVPSDKNPEQGVVECITNNTNQKEVFFRCGMKFSHEEREEILTNKGKYIGQIAEVRFFEYTDDGLPRFPVCVGFRLDK